VPLTPQDIETHFGIQLPARHLAALLDSSDPIHERTFLLTAEGNDCQSIFKVNARLRALEWKEWPGYLVAFATNECGDYFALDARTAPYKIYYIDPIDTVPESIAGNHQSGFVFNCFDDWYENEISP
jgi:hypothetical protein